MMHFLLLQKLAKVPLKSRFHLAIVILYKCKYILLNKNVRMCNYLKRTCKYIPQGLSAGFLIVPRGFRWFPLVIPGYPRFYLVILVYTWLRICVKSFTHLQLSFPSFAEIFCSRGQIKWPWGNQGKPREPAIIQIYTTSKEEFIRIFLYTSGNDFF